MYLLSAILLFIFQQHEIIPEIDVIYYVGLVGLHIIKWIGREYERKYK